MKRNIILTLALLTVLNAFGQTDTTLNKINHYMTSNTITPQILIPSLLGLLGVIIGALATSFVNLKLKSKETKLRIVEKIFDKRIQAHENILLLTKDIKTVVSTREVDENYNIISFPKSLISKDEYSHFLNQTCSIIHQNNHWFNTDLERELGFLQDYLASVNQTIKDVDDIKLPLIGLVIKQDFIDLAANLDKLTFDFFRKDIYKLSINKHDEWHKYPKDITLKRYEETLLYRKQNEIDKIINVT
jgi:hypothetical protein